MVNKSFKDMNSAIDYINNYIKNPCLGLPEQLFTLVSRLTPLVNVDLLIKDENKRILLSWRDDKYSGVGWHIPGGIVRFMEKLETRIKEVSKIEIKTEVKYNLIPLKVQESIFYRDNFIRSHFIAFLYRCSLSNKVKLNNKGLKEGDVGYLKWHDSCPKNLIKCQKIYSKYFSKEF